MTHCGKCDDNAVADISYRLLKRERIKRRNRDARQNARSDVFDYIELIYNTTRSNSMTAGLSPVEFELRRS